MKVKLKKNISMKKLADIFSIPHSLLKASHSMRQTSFKKGEKIFIPGYEFKKYKTKDVNENIYKKYKLTNKMVQLINDLNYTYIYLPVKRKNLLIEDFNHYTFEKMMTHIQKLIELYPFIQKNIIGYSHQNRPIIELTIGNGLYQTHFNASFHANEWITSAVLMKCINKYAQLLINSKHDRSLIRKFNETKISFVPMVNPDGVNLVLNGLTSAKYFKSNVLAINNNNDYFNDWKANIVGVDLNKQYPALWEKQKKRGYNTPSFRDYSGKEPLTEPEAIAMASLAKRRNFKRIHALHTQGEEIYWGFQEKEPEISEKIARLYCTATNYKCVRYIDNYGGYKDWFIKTFKRPGFTIELGKGKNPLPFAQFYKLSDVTYHLLLTNLLLTI